MMFLYFSLLYMGDNPFVSYNVILEYSIKKKKNLGCIPDLV